ncbi:MAG: hypothetical protein KJ896_02780, partial [Nanoarchaeota archaeon]|nr:hypothetical protein [Nanoarchaeota archaeon]
FEGKEIPIKAAKLLEKINSLIGLGVIEQSTNSITAKNFFSLDKELSPKVLLRKMDIVNRASFSLLGNFFNKNFAQEDFFELRKLHEQNKNLFTLIRKCILKLLENPNLMNSMQTNHIQINKERIFAQNLRNISLMLQVIGGSFLFLDAKSPEAKELKKYFMGIEKDYQRMINATENNSYELIYSLLNDFDKRTREIDNFVKSLSDPLAVRITTSFLTMYRNIKDYSIESST